MNQPLSSPAPMEIDDDDDEGHQDNNVQDQHQLLPRCKGTTSLGGRCKRTQPLNDDGYCYQHIDQMMSTPSTPSTPSNNNNNSDVAPISPSVEDVDVVVDEEEEAVSVVADENDGLTRCKAIAATTKLRCKKMVSFAGEDHCPTHGGRQHKAKVLMALCEATSKSTRQPCKRRVGFHGERFCSHHGGRKLTEQAAGAGAAGAGASSSPSSPAMTAATATATMMTTIPAGSSADANANASNAANTAALVARWMHQYLPQQQPEVTVKSKYNWLKLSQQCGEFLTETHPRMIGTCGCTTLLNQNCKAMAIIKWMQCLLKIVEVNGNHTDPTTITDATVFMPLLMGPLALFGDFYMATGIFGNNTLDFLPELFNHVHRLVDQTIMDSMVMSRQNMHSATHAASAPPSAAAPTMNVTAPTVVMTPMSDLSDIAQAAWSNISPGLVYPRTLDTVDEDHQQQHQQHRNQHQQRGIVGGPH